MQKAILWVLGLIIIIVGWYLFTTEPNNSPESSQVAGEQANGAVVDVTGGETKSAKNAEVTVEVSPVVPATVITYTDTGFVPSSVTIKKGQSVRWMNNSGSGVWPASAVHPTHSIYPQKSASDCLGSSFDSCRGLAKGESWDFAFNSVGEWRFHDHLHASKTGVVNVTE